MDGSECLYSALIFQYRRPSGATGQAVLAEIQSRYEKTNDIEANFIQEYIGKG